MNDYKTVKEVCALTGLTGKHLYYFHHENVVRAAAYANYSVVGNDGYKLYDAAGVEKLRQIAVYYQFGLKRNEIRDLMLDPNYDSTQVLKRLLVQKRAEGAHLERQLAALEYLIELGLENALPESVPADFAEALGRRQAELKREQASEIEIATRKVTADVK